MLIGGDKRTKKRKVGEYLKDNGGIIVGIVLFLSGVGLFILAGIIQAMGVSQ